MRPARPLQGFVWAGPGGDAQPCVWACSREGEVTRALVPSWTCSSVRLWNGIIAAGYGNGQIRLYEAATGSLRAQVGAHARWIYALDLAPATGKVWPRGPGAGQGLLHGQHTVLRHPAVPTASPLSLCSCCRVRRTPLFTCGSSAGARTLMMLR